MAWWWILIAFVCGIISGAIIMCVFQSENALRGDGGKRVNE